MSLIMEDDNTLPSLVGGDVNSAASSVSHSFYSNTLFSMTRDDMSDDNFLQRLSMKSSHHNRSSASAMATNELMMASIQRLYDDMVGTSACSDKEDDQILDMFAMAKRHETIVDVTSDAGAFSSQLPMQKQIDPPEENDVEPSTTTSPRNTSNPRDRYRRMNTDGNPQMYAQNGTGVESKHQYIRRYTDPCCTDEKERVKRKPDPIGTASTRLTCNRKSAPYSDEDSLLELAGRMSNSCGIEDTPSIEGPTDNYYWANSRHSSVISDSGSSCKERSRRRKSLTSRYRSRSRRSVRSKKKHWYDDDEYDDEERQQTGGNSKGSKMKGLLYLIAGKTNKKRGLHRHNRDRLSRSRSMSSSRCSSRNSNRVGSSSGSLSSNYYRQSSRKSVSSSYSSSSRRKLHERKTMLSVAEAVAYLNKRERMAKSPSLSSFRSYSSIKSNASKLSSISRNSRRSSVSSKSNGGKNTTVSKVVGAASGLKKKIRRRVV